MKTARFLPILLLMIAVCAFASDADIRKSLVGTWRLVQTRPQDRNIVSLMIFAPSADFTNRIIFPGAVNAIENSGTFQVQDGCLVLTIKSMDLQAVEHLPMVTRSKIIQADDIQLVIVDDGATNKQTFKKVTR